MDYESYLQSQRWYYIRSLVRQRSGGHCERCLYGSHDHTHHLTYARRGQERLSDLLAVCKSCHGFLHGKFVYDSITDATELPDVVIEEERYWYASRMLREYRELGVESKLAYEFVLAMNKQSFKPPLPDSALDLHWFKRTWAGDPAVWIDQAIATQSATTHHFTWGVELLKGSIFEEDQVTVIEAEDLDQIETIEVEADNDVVLLESEDV